MPDRRQPARTHRSPLARGEAIRRWLYGDAVSTHFPGRSRPNPDHVDYEFGLIGAKTGQSPAREALHKRVVAEAAGPPSGPFDKLYVGGLSPNIDFSFFAFEPTLVTRPLRCQLQAGRAGAATFRIATCGCLRLWLGDRFIESFAPFQRNLESAREVLLDLPDGPVALTVELEDLHERDTQNYFSVTYLSGVPVEVALGVEQEPQLHAVADMIDTLESRDVFHEAGPLMLRTEAPLPHDQVIEVTRLKQVRRADAHEDLDIPPFRMTLESGADTLQLPAFEVLPSGCAEIGLRTGVSGVEIAKVIGTTILTRGTRHTQETLQGRKDEALALSAQDTGGEATMALAYLATRGDTERAAVILERALEGIERRYDCSDFTILPVLRIWRDHRAKLPTALRQRIESAILGYRYWMSEPGNDAMWFWSENHVLCFHVAQLAAGHLFADREFSNSARSGADLEQEAAARLRRWFDSIERHGLCEVNSAAYYPIDIFALLTLYELSPDAALRDRTARLLDSIFVMAALHQTDGVPAGAQGRCYEKELLSGAANELASLAAVAFGGVRYPAYGRAALNFCLSDYAPPAIAASLARPPGDRLIEAQYVQGAGGIAKLKLWKNEHAQVSTASDHATGTMGSQQHVLDVQFADHPMARLWINHPGDRKPWSERRPSKLAGNHWLPRIAQHRQHAFAIYDVPDDPRFVPFVQLCAMANAFDHVEEIGEHVVFRSGGYCAVVWCSEPLQPEASGPYAGSVRRANALRSGWVVSLESAADDAAYRDLCADIAARRPSFDPWTMTLQAAGFELSYSGRFTLDGVEVGFACTETKPHISVDGAPYRPWDEIDVS